MKKFFLLFLLCLPVFAASGSRVSTTGFTEQFNANSTNAITARNKLNVNSVWAVEDFSAVADGTTDNQLSVSNAVVAAAGGTLVFPSGTTLSKGQIPLVSNLRIEGKSGAIIKQGSTNTILFCGTNINNLLFENITFEGANDYTGTSDSSLQHSRAFSLYLSTNVTFRNVIFTNWGFSGFVGNTNWNYTFENCKWYGPSGVPSEGSWNFAVYGSRQWVNWSMRNCEITGTAIGLLWADDSWHCKILGNFIHDIPGQHGAYFNEVHGLDYSFNTISNCVYTGTKVQMHDISVNPSEGVKITKNVFWNTGSHALDIHNATAPTSWLLTNLLVSGNIMSGTNTSASSVQGTSAGIYLNQVSGAHVEDNFIQGKDLGIYCDGCTYVSMDRNEMWNIEDYAHTWLNFTNCWQRKTVLHNVAARASQTKPDAIYISGTGVLRIDGMEQPDVSANQSWLIHLVGASTGPNVYFRGINSPTKSVYNENSATSFGEWVDNHIGGVQNTPSSYGQAFVSWPGVIVGTNAMIRGNGNATRSRDLADSSNVNHEALAFASTGGHDVLFDTSLDMASGNTIRWSNSSSDYSQTKDTGIARGSAGVLKVTDGGSNRGGIQATTVDGSGAATFDNLTVTNASALTGAITAGSTIKPSADGTQDAGDSAHRWRNIYGSGGFSVGIAGKNAGYTITTNDWMIAVNGGGAAATITLPSAAMVAVGKWYRVYNADTAASTTNVLTLATTSSQTISGFASGQYIWKNQYLDVHSDGTNWYAAPMTYHPMIVAANDQAVTSNNSSLIDCTNLCIPLLANRTYAFQFYLRITFGGTLPGVKVGLSGPSSPTTLMYIAEGGVQNAAESLFTVRGSAFGSNFGPIGAGATTDVYIKIVGFIHNGSSSDYLRPAFMQSVSDSAATTVKADSIGEAWLYQ